MADLIERLSALTGPDREVDALIAREVGVYDPQNIFRYTGSLDAKLPGEDIIGVSEQKQQTDHPPKWIAVHRMQHGRMSIAGRGATEPIARRIAALRARMADRSGA